MQLQGEMVNFFLKNEALRGESVKNRPTGIMLKVACINFILTKLALSIRLTLTATILVHIPSISTLQETTSSLPVFCNACN